MDGVVLGTLYAMIGLGLSLVWGLMGILNFAHNNFLLVAVYLAIFAVSFTVNPYLATIVALALLAVISLVAYRTLITPVFKFGLDAAMMNTFALSYFLVICVLTLAGPFYRSGVAIFPADLRLQLPLGIVYSGYRILAAVFAAVLLAGTVIFIRKSMFGTAMRAAMQDTQASVLVGIRLRRVTEGGFLIATLLAGIAGIIIAPMYTVFPTFADRYAIIAFAVALLGGLGNVEGVIPAGIIIGLTEALGSVYISSPYKDAFIYIILIAILLIRPVGLLGRK
jgi:branched-chain amino acid transport system permease protein